MDEAALVRAFEWCGSQDADWQRDVNGTWMEYSWNMNIYMNGILVILVEYQIQHLRRWLRDVEIIIRSSLHVFVASSSNIQDNQDILALT
jgi:hypothetical protein